MVCVLVAGVFCLCLISAHAADKKMAGLTHHARAMENSKAVPGTLSYQGYLADASDSSAVSATLEMTFKLFDSETKGAELWSETHPAVEVSGGLFQVLLGSETAFPTGLFDGTPLWLQTEIGAEVLAPRKLIASTAYSHRANSAEMLLDYTLGDLDDRWVNEGQANSVTSAMVTDGEIVDDDVSATADIHPGKIAGTAWTADNDGPGSGLNADMVDGQQAADFIDMSDLDHLDAADGDPADAVSVDDDGNVGIGTTTPTTELEVNGSVTATTYYGDGSHLTGISGTADSDWTIDGDDVYHQTGNVGIGLTIPTARLDVDGTTRIGNPVASFTSVVGVGIIAEDATFSSVPLAVVDSDIDPILYARGNGKVGIGTFNPGATLEVNYDNASPSTPAIVINNENAVGQSALDFQFAGTTDARIRIAATGGLHIGTVTGDLNLLTNNTQRLHIASDGKVGIGTGSPGKLLDVAGGIRGDTLSLGSAAKAGVDGQIFMYRDGSGTAIVDIEDDGNDGGAIWLRDASGHTHASINPDSDGDGGYFYLNRSASSLGFVVDGNDTGTEEPHVMITGSSQSASFRMKESGDASVVLPNNAISDVEMLDEPGVASDGAGAGGTELTGGIDILLSRTITVPDSGYVLAIGTVQPQFSHAHDTTSSAKFGVSDESSSFPGNQDVDISIPLANPSGLYQLSVTPHGLFKVAPGSQTFYLLGDEYSGDWTVYDKQLTLIYFRTAYGDVDATKSEEPGLPDGQNPSFPSLTPADIAAEQAQARAFDAARIERELAAMRAELAAMKKELRDVRQ
jgi:hypothetical protein